MSVAMLVIRVVLELAQLVVQALEQDDMDALLKLRLDDILPQTLKSQLAREAARERARQKFGS